MGECVVLDTNVFVAAGFNPRSSSAQILEAVSEGRLRHVWEPGTRGEVRAVLQQIPPLSRERRAGLFREGNRFDGEIRPEDFGYVSDPDDRKFLALADAADATLISNDEHLLSHRESSPVPILTPGEFWEASEAR
jgi:predicted nucleic acid-binding protein